MEKKEARIKCSGCGTSYKIRIPVTDKPVSFTCKKCGKVLKLKVKAPATPSPQSRPDLDFKPPTNFETTQLPEEGDYHDSGIGVSGKSADFVEDHVFEQAAPSAGPRDEMGRHWLVLAHDQINGPFTGSEVIDMIRSSRVTAQTSLRMGERPWVKASEVAEFKGYFFEPLKNAAGAALETISLLDKEEEEGPSEGSPTTGLFYEQIPAIVSYPISGGKPLPLALFAGMAFVAATALSFEVVVGFFVSIALWLLLYGYLSNLMNQSKVNPQNPPPDWDFSKIKSMVADGVNILVVLAVYTVIPVVAALLAAVYFWVNRDVTLGYALVIVSMILYLGSLFTVPAGLVIVDGTRSVGSALNPGRVLGVITKGGKAYLMLVLFSVVVGLTCITMTWAGVMFFSHVIPFGFVVSGLLMALILSYAHFVWFHVLGRFSAENKKLLTAG
ncbi:MAG: DUF4013 domain-containing protein [Desulfomonilaceae bacterium]|nr:DUF4013 domain-containing protein [Desulfomonilaceae bacterium]